MKTLSLAATNILLVVVLILTLLILLAVSRLGLQLQQEVTPRVYQKTVYVPVTPTAEATPSAAVKGFLYATPSARRVR